jgi:hypothetical protein
MLGRMKNRGEYGRKYQVLPKQKAKGIRLPLHTTIMLGRMKDEREYDRKYQALPKQKPKRANLKFAKMKNGLEKQMADKAMGLNYKTGMSMLQTGEDGIDGHSKK